MIKFTAEYSTDTGEPLPCGGVDPDAVVYEERRIESADKEEAKKKAAALIAAHSLDGEGHLRSWEFAPIDGCERWEYVEPGTDGQDAIGWTNFESDYISANPEK